MKYYKEICEKEIITFKDVVNITGSNKNAICVLEKLLDQGYIHKVKRDLYTTINLTTQADFATNFMIGSAINKTSFISYHTAFEFYGFYNQVFYTLYISSKDKFSSFNYNDYHYNYIKTNTTKQVVNIQNVNVTTIERTIVDCINMCGKHIDLEELIKCISLIHYINIDNIKEMLLEYDKDILYRKVGYVLTFFKHDFNIPDSFFTFCLSHSQVHNVGKISHHEINDLEFIPEWGLYAYKDLLKLVNKGVNDDVLI